MKCEGESEWNGLAAWAIHFQQRAGAKGHLLFCTDGYGVAHAAKVKGRAWISVDSGEVVHLETALMQAIPEARVRDEWFSIDYGPVRFRTRNVSVWLPQAADSFTQFDDPDSHRMIIYHTFENFMLFSVQVRQEIGKPPLPHCGNGEALVSELRAERGANPFVPSSFISDPRRIWTQLLVSSINVFIGGAHLRRLRARERRSGARPIKP
jgi:hypothetical protein